MNRIFSVLALSALMSTTIISCSSDDDSAPDPTPTPSEPKLVFKFKFDSTQVRLNGLGQPAVMPAGHQGQSPVFNKMSAHYIEMTHDMFTALGAGEVIYHNAETTAGGDTAIDFSKSILAGQNGTFYSVNLKDVTPGTYNFLRVSLAYQNYNVKFRASGFDLTGTIASFIGYNTYVTNYKIKDSLVNVNANKLQGYWAFEVNNPPFSVPVAQGQAPPGATTVPNPIFATSPIPQGSCVVTGSFSSPLTITGNETSDIVITVSLSTNKSFEWVEHSDPNYYEPLAGDTVVDMGIRGLIPIVN